MTGVMAVLSAGSGGIVSVFPTFAVILGDESPLFTNVVTASVAGGGTFTFVWTYVSGDAEITKDFSDGAVMRWRANIAPSTSYVATWRVTALQFGSPVGFSDVSVTIERV